MWSEDKNKKSKWLLIIWRVKRRDKDEKKETKWWKDKIKDDDD